VSNVKGSALASRVLWVRLERGEAGLARLVARASPALRATIERGVEKARWYPFEQFIELNLAIDQLFGNGDLALVRQLGRYGADANLTTIYRLFFKVGTVHWILGRAVRLWDAHYDSGRMGVVPRGPTSALLRIHAFATPHPAHCLSVLGWCERSIELSGGKHPVMEETRCRTRGDELCQIKATWD
jgi:hypothetical protein